MRAIKSKNGIAYYTDETALSAPLIPANQPAMLALVNADKAARLTAHSGIRHQTGENTLMEWSAACVCSFFYPCCFFCFRIFALPEANRKL